MRGRAFAILLLLGLTAALVYAVLFLSAPIAQADRAAREDRNVYLLAVGFLGLILSVYSLRSRNASPSERALFWLAALLPAYAALQILPLPVEALRILSPARAELVDALAPLSLRGSFAPLSVAPSLSLVHFLLLAAYGVVFFAVREIARSSATTRWLTVLPILGIAAWQGLWGMEQYLAGGGEPFAHGAYAVRNHYAGLLEMSLPFAIAYTAEQFRREEQSNPISASKALGMGGGFVATAFVIAGILASLSRMGLVACMGSLLAMGTLLLVSKLPGTGRWKALLGWGTAMVLAIALIAPVQLILRFTEISAEGRLDVWKDTLHLIAAYPIFGTGLGGYQSAFERFKTSGFIYAQDYAHNDYLQLLAELGLVGFLIAAAFAILILARSARSGVRHPDPDARWLGLACVGGLVAILIHSAADFNLYVPANAMLLAWICGVAAGGLALAVTSDLGTEAPFVTPQNFPLRILPRSSRR